MLIALIRSESSWEVICGLGCVMYKINLNFRIIIERLYKSVMLW
jgi:hypothetical protein